MASRALGDEIVALDLRSSTYLSTNLAGTLLWRELERGSTRSQLVQALLDEFDVTHERAVADVDAFVDELRRRGLLADFPAQGEVESG